MTADLLLDAVHRIMRKLTGLKLVGDLHERATFPGFYPPLDPVLRRRLALIREIGVLFIHIPKNAGMSISSVLYGEQLFHPTIRYYLRVAGDIARNLPSFAVWRDPAERFASAYRYARTGGVGDVSISRAFRERYLQFTSIDDALDHVEATPSLYDLDHIFRPQFWYVADMVGRIGVDRICLIDDLENAVNRLAIPGLQRLAWINRSEASESDITDVQRLRIKRLYPIDFAIYDALRAKSIPAAVDMERLKA